MSFEDAAKIILSAGMANPDAQAHMRELADKAKRKEKKGEDTPSSTPELPAPTERVDT
jgi:uncharacterized membrane protein